jgi:hypothetical protein
MGWALVSDDRTAAASGFAIGPAKGYPSAASADVCARLTTVFDDDPGWAFSWRTFLWFLIPQLGLRRQVKRAEAGEVDGLLMLRQVFMSFCCSIAAFGVVLARPRVPPRRANGGAPRRRSGPAQSAGL